MRIADEINDLKEIVGISPELLVCRVAEAFEKFESNEAQSRIDLYWVSVGLSSIQIALLILSILEQSISVRFTAIS